MPQDVTLVYEPSVIRHSIWDTEALVFISEKKLTECLEHEMATNQQVVVIAQDPEGPENSPDVFTTYKKAVTGMSIAMQSHAERCAEEELPRHENPLRRNHQAASMLLSG